MLECTLQTGYGLLGVTHACAWPSAQHGSQTQLSESRSHGHSILGAADGFGTRPEKMMEALPERHLAVRTVYRLEAGSPKEPEALAGVSGVKKG